MKTIQKCPICEGKGIVAGGFYNHTGETWVSDRTAETCRQCNGKGIIIIDDKNGGIICNENNNYP